MSDELARNLLSGAQEIADFIGLTRAQVYHANASGELPTFRVGTRIYARKSTILTWIADQEKTALTQPNKAA